VGDDYFVATSTFEYFPGVPIYQSRDLVEWRLIGHALTRDEQLSLQTAKSSQGIFAPTLRYHAGIFYLVTTDVSGGGNFYVTATHPAGPWSNPICLEKEACWMDPSLFFDDDGRVYFTRHGGGRHGAIYQAELDLARGKLVSEPRLIWSGTGDIWPEGPHLFKRGGWYYLTNAEGGTSYEHMQVIARSRSPYGPFEGYAKNPILTHRTRPEHPVQALGHADFVEGPDGRWWMVFLGVRPSAERHHHLGRETFLAAVEWDAEGWPSVKLEETARAPSNRVVRDDFDAQQLALEYNFVRNPERARYRLDARAGFLRLLGSPTGLDEVGAPTFVGRRQQHFDCRIRAALEFEPAQSSDEAGLVLRANEDNHFALLVQSAGAGRELVLRARRRGATEIVARAELSPGPLVLEVRATRERYEFACRAPAPIVLGSLPTRDLSTETTGGFTGVYAGMYAKSPSAEPPGADFDWFEYAPGDA
ncbi:MAG TPA: glycoside hydrolase family 43 protein, partial [Polyangiaceae bacterium]|nr:glycoside hydrolase family 43 protein [Polyangiaceae bacterium]